VFRNEGQRIWQKLIITIKEDHPVAARSDCAGIVRRTHAAISLMTDQPQARVRIAGDNVRGVIRGRIIHHDHFEIVKWLCQAALQCPANLPWSVVEWNRDA
jgi:hypothetical protein